MLVGNPRSQSENLTIKFPHLWLQAWQCRVYSFILDGSILGGLIRTMCTCRRTGRIPSLGSGLCHTPVRTVSPSPLPSAALHASRHRRHQTGHTRPTLAILPLDPWYRGIAQLSTAATTLYYLRISVSAIARRRRPSAVVASAPARRAAVAAVASAITITRYSVYIASFSTS